MSRILPITVRMGLRGVGRDRDECIASAAGRAENHCGGASSDPALPKVQNELVTGIMLIIVNILPRTL